MLHRIPYGKSQQQKPSQLGRPVFFQVSNYTLQVYDVKILKLIRNAARIFRVVRRLDHRSCQSIIT